MKQLILTTLAVLALQFHAGVTLADDTLPPAEHYREFTLKIRKSGSFQIPMPSNGDMAIRYELRFSDPLYSAPIVSDIPLSGRSRTLMRSFWDKVFLADGSYLFVGEEKVPLTCIFISGQDNRFYEKTSPLYPDYIFRVYLVANDYACTGPLNPGWPFNGGKKEMWDTYLHFEVRDPTIMLPVDAKVRYRWNEFSAVLVDDGSDK